MDNLNSCCFVSKISKIEEIKGADNIELAIVGGWNCITKKREYKEGDLIIVATTDAVIPQELSDAMEVTNYLRRGQRVRTVKLRGVYSECLIIPSQFAPIGSYHQEGKDMMKIMNIFKYEPPVKQVQLSSGRKIKYKDNPNFHIYYKFPNIKNTPGMFTEEDEVEITRKIHGTNARYGIVRKNKLSLWDKVRKFLGSTNKSVYYEFVVGSHNVEKGSDSQGFYDTNVWYEIANKYEIKKKLWRYANRLTISEFGDGIIIYGEIYGVGIQKGYDYRIPVYDDNTTGHIRFAGFDVKNNNQYCNTFASKAIMEIDLDLPYVEILYVGKWSQKIQDKFVFNNYIPGTKIPHEGIVIKHLSGERNKVAKVINPDYLIYGEKNNIGDSH
jgi:RNA ligase (TIGR02306 family)